MPLPRTLEAKCKKIRTENLFDIFPSSRILSISNCQFDWPHFMIFHNKISVLNIVIAYISPDFGYPGMQQPGQGATYAQFHYPNASGDQNAQLLQGYALPQQGTSNAGVPGGMFGGQSMASYNFDQTTAAYSQSPSVPVCQVGSGSQVHMQAGMITCTTIMFSTRRVRLSRIFRVI